KLVFERLCLFLRILENCAVVYDIVPKKVELYLMNHVVLKFLNRFISELIGMCREKSIVIFGDIGICDFCYINIVHYGFALEVVDIIVIGVGVFKGYHIAEIFIIEIKGYTYEF